MANTCTFENLSITYLKIQSSVSRLSMFKLFLTVKKMYEVCQEKIFCNLQTTKCILANADQNSLLVVGGN